MTARPPVGDTTGPERKEPTRAKSRWLGGMHSVDNPLPTPQPQPTDEPGLYEGLGLVDSARTRRSQKRALSQPSGPDFVGAVAEIRALHSWTPDHVDHRTGMWVDICDICHVEHPCPTVQILNEAGRP